MRTVVHQFEDHLNINTYYAWAENKRIIPQLVYTLLMCKLVCLHNIDIEIVKISKPVFFHYVITYWDDLDIEM